MRDHENDVDEAIDWILDEGQLCDVCHEEEGDYEPLTGGFLGDNCRVLIQRRLNEHFGIPNDTEGDHDGAD